MAQSNNTPGSDKTLSESNSIDYSQECNNTANKPIIEISTSDPKIRKEEFLMSEEAFLELIPVNGYFH